MVSLSDADLLAYIDGQASAEIAGQVEGSPENLARARKLKQMQASLLAHLYRADCPDSLLLGEFFHGLLHPGEAARIRRHLDLCPHCLEEYAQLQVFFTPQPDVIERARTWIARLLSGDPFGQPALALGLRGETPRVYAAGNVQIVLNFQVDARLPGRKSLAGLVLGQPAAGWEVHLLKSSERVAMVTVDDMGNFIFPDLPSGEYGLHLNTHEDHILIPFLNLE